MDVGVKAWGKGHCIGWTSDRIRCSPKLDFGLSLNATLCKSPNPIRLADSDVSLLIGWKKGVTGKCPRTEMTSEPSHKCSLMTLTYIIIFMKTSKGERGGCYCIADMILLLIVKYIRINDMQTLVTMDWKQIIWWKLVWQCSV